MEEIYMSPDPERADDPLRWLANALADLALARIPLPKGGLYEHLCFHAQQAVEKALKAVLQANEIEYPFTHNIQLLIDLLPTSILAPPAILAAVDLTPYAVMTRYPGEVEPVTAEEHEEAVCVATIVLKWAESLLKS
jgi:HEPN domain-containing protein